MSCPAFESLSRWVDGALPEAEADKVAAHVEECTTCTKATGRIARLSGLVADAAVGDWEPAAAPGAGCPSAADFAGWSAGGRSDVDEHIAGCGACLARAVDLFRALAAKSGRTLGPVPADAAPARTASRPPAVAAGPEAPRITLRGYPGRFEIVNVPDGVKVDEDGHVKAFAWKAGARDVMADVSPSGSGLGLRLRIKSGGTLEGGVPVAVTDRKSRRPFSNKPTDLQGEVVVRGMPITSFRVEVSDSPVDVVFE